MTRVGIASLLLLSAVGCAERPLESQTSRAPSDDPCLPRPERIVLTPSVSEIEVGDHRSTRAMFRAVALFSGGAARVVPASFRLSIPEAGAIDSEGIFTASEMAGGEVTVEARAGGVEASAHLGIKLVKTLPLDVPAADVERFQIAHPRVADPPPRLLAPPDGARISREAPLELAWDGAGHTLFRVSLRSATTDVQLYARTQGVVVPDDLRRSLADSNRGRAPSSDHSEGVRVVLEAVDPDDERVHVAEPRALGFCQPDELCNATDDDCDEAIDEDCHAIPWSPASSVFCSEMP